MAVDVGISMDNVLIIFSQVLNSALWFEIISYRAEYQIKLLLTTSVSTPMEASSISFSSL
jgi:hypothetical protein